MKNSELLTKITDRLNQANDIALFAHIRPDGDTVGSVLGLGTALKEAGKKVQFVSQDKIPDNMSFLFEDFGIKNPFISVPQSFDCAVVMDVSDRKRSGSWWEAHPDRIPDICIDHHATNAGFAVYNWIEPRNPATAAIAAELIPDLGLNISKFAASALLSGIITDTIGFSTSNMNADILCTAGKLIEKGADIFKIQYKLIKEKTYAKDRYWGCGLQKIQRRGRIIWTDLTIEDRKISEYPVTDDADLINELSATEGFDVAIIFIEQDPNCTKISWRGKPGTDVSRIAAVFGGGGHVAAAGATVDASLNDAVEKVLSTTEKMIKTDYIGK